MSPATPRRISGDPHSLSPANLIALQRTVGNKAVRRLIQRKLTVGAAHDAYEQEADRVADQVMSAPQAKAKPAVQRVGEEDEQVQTKPLVQRQEEEDEVQTKPLADSITPLVQRVAEENPEEAVQTKPLVQRQEEEDEVQTKPLADSITPLVQRAVEEEDEVQTKRTDPFESFEPGGDFQQRLDANSGGGSPLPGETRDFMESRFGTDFGNVRVHSGGESAQLNRQVSAQAFTHGSDIYLGEGKTDIQSNEGKHLLAHELTHVVQQTGATGVSRISRRPKAIQRVLVAEAGRAFKLAAGRGYTDVRDPSLSTTYDELKDHTDKLMPKGHQEEIIKLRGKTTSWRSKSPEAEKRLKDALRAWLLSSYAARLFKLEAQKLGKKDYDKKRDQYYDRVKDERDKQKSLVEKGVAAPETQAWLNFHGFADVVPVTPEQSKTEIAKGPRIDVRSTFIAGPIFGVKVRAHLFIVYTDSKGKQVYFRGGPGNGNKTVADTGDYTPNTVDWDPSAPSVTVLSGDAARSKLDALIEATHAINPMAVPYTGQSGENCNATAWTILNRAGIPTSKPSGVHPGWGAALGSRTVGKENAQPAKEDFSGTTGKPMVIKGKSDAKVKVYIDRTLREMAKELLGGSPVQLLDQIGGGNVRIKYETSKIGYLKESELELPPLGGKAFQLSIDTEVVGVGSKTVQHFLPQGTEVMVVDPSFKGGAEGEFVEIRYEWRDQQFEGLVLDYNLENI
ncbi:MAG: DUF4157 domain-containing protein [Anaerolineae bacterium]